MGIPAADNWWQPKCVGFCKADQPKQASKKKEKQGEEEKRMPADTWKKTLVNNFWIRIVKRNGFPMVSQTDKFLTTFYIKNTSPQVAKFQAIMVLTNVWCSSIFYVWVSAADSWWQPKQASKIKGKARVGREENASGYPAKKQSVNNFWIRIVKRNGFPMVSQIDMVFDNYTLHQKNTVWQVAKFQAIMVLTHVRCSSIFYVWVSAADNWWQPKQASKRKGKARGGREENTSEHPEENNPSITFWIWIVERNRFPKLTWFWQLHFTLQECRLKFTNGSPHKLPNLRQSLTHVRCSSIFYAWVSAANNWWQQTSIQDKRKSKGRKRRECQRIPAKKQSSITFGSELWKEMGFNPKLTSFWLHFTSKNTPHELPNFRQSLYWQVEMFIQILCMGIPAADTWWQPKQSSITRIVKRNGFPIQIDKGCQEDWKRCSSIFYVWVSAAILMAAKQASKKKENNRKRREYKRQ